MRGLARLDELVGAVEALGQRHSAYGVTAGHYDTSFAKPAEGGTLTVSATLTDAAGNVSLPGSDSATLDTTAPAAPTVTITTDADNNTLISKAEQGVE